MDAAEKKVIAEWDRTMKKLSGAMRLGFLTGLLYIALLAYLLWVMAAVMGGVQAAVLGVLIMFQHMAACRVAKKQVAVNQMTEGAAMKTLEHMQETGKLSPFAIFLQQRARYDRN